MTNTPRAWEEGFDKDFVVKSNAGTNLFRYTDADKIKQRIRTIEDEAVRRERDRAVKIVTNETLNHFTRDYRETDSTRDRIIGKLLNDN